MLNIRNLILCVQGVFESNDEITKGADYDILVPWLGTGLLIRLDSRFRNVPFSCHIHPYHLMLNVVVIFLSLNYTVVKISRQDRSGTNG